MEFKPHFDALLKATILALVPMRRIDGAILRVAARVLQVPPHRSLEEAADKRMLSKLSKS